MTALKFVFCFLSIGLIAPAMAQSEDALDRSCMLLASEKLPKAPGLIVVGAKRWDDPRDVKKDQAGKIQSAIIGVSLEVKAFGVEATYRFMCGFKNGNLIGIESAGLTP